MPHGDQTPPVNAPRPEAIEAFADAATPEEKPAVEHVTVGLRAAAPARTRPATMPSRFTDAELPSIVQAQADDEEGSMHNTDLRALRLGLRQLARERG